jgi:N-methylhydantoinase A
VTYSIAVDIGGTFTDVVLMAQSGAIATFKTLTTPDDFGRGIASGIQGVLQSQGARPSEVRRVVHATTVATNAILEHKGAITGLVTTAGFRDVLEMRRLRIPEMYALNYPRPDPLVPRRLRLEVTERLAADGSVRVPLDEASVQRVAQRFAAEQVEAVAVSLLHAYANPAHEQRVAAILREMLGQRVFISCSADILPVIREYERTSTTVINAFLGPTLAGYFDSLKRHLAGIGIDAPIHVMKSDGGVMTVGAAAVRPAYLVESGPAAGVIGAAALASEDVITFDMGGTTAKVSVVEGGKVQHTGDYEVGAGINLSSKLVMGGGYALKLPVIDISEVGAGGGSLVALDAGGLLRVGPQSAGAMPGPVCYDQGGAQATFTDAALVLGYLNPNSIAGGGLRLAPAKAHRALAEQVAKPLGRSELEAAFGVLQVAASTMVRAVKAVTTYRGRDPREFALYAFGGNGPLVGAIVADLLQIERVVVPPHPGVFSAYGLMHADVEHESVAAFLVRLRATTPAKMDERLAALEKALLARMAGEGHPRERIELLQFADLRYTGQAHEITTPVHREERDFVRLARAFGDEHERTYGHQAEAEEVECVALRVVARVASELRPGKSVPRPSGAAGKRDAFFGPRQGLLPTSVLGRANLATPRRGPLIVEEYDSTCVVPPGWSATLDAQGNLVLSHEKR